MGNFIQNRPFMKRFSNSNIFQMFDCKAPLLFPQFTVCHQHTCVRKYVSKYQKVRYVRQRVVVQTKAKLALNFNIQYLDIVLWYEVWNQKTLVYPKAMDCVMHQLLPDDQKCKWISYEVGLDQLQGRTLSTAFELPWTKKVHFAYEESRNSKLQVGLMKRNKMLKG